MCLLTWKTVDLVQLLKQWWTLYPSSRQCDTFVQGRYTFSETGAFFRGRYTTSEGGCSSSDRGVAFLREVHFSKTDAFCWGMSFLWKVSHFQRKCVFETDSSLLREVHFSETAASFLRRCIFHWICQSTSYHNQTAPTTSHVNNVGLVTCILISGFVTWTLISNNQRHHWSQEVTCTWHRSWQPHQFVEQI